MAEHLCQLGQLLLVPQIKTGKKQNKKEEKFIKKKKKKKRKIIINNLTSFKLKINKKNISDILFHISELHYMY